MTKAKRLRAALRGEKTDRLPWAVWPGFMPLGAAERGMRNRGLGLYLPTITHVLDPADLDMEDEFITEPEIAVRRAKRIYRTPHGTLTGTIDFPYKPAFHVMFAEMAVYPPGMVPGEGISQHGHDMSGGAGRDRENPHVAPRKFPFGGPEDYLAVEHIIQNTTYHPDYKQIARTLDWMGGEGIAMATLWNTPFQEIANDWMGRARAYEEWKERPQSFRRLHDVIAARQQKLLQIVIDSPAEEIWIGDDLDSEAVTPEAFEEFFLPYYNEVADAIHAADKVVGVMASGRLKALAPLLAKTRLDFLDGVQAPPVGDFKIEEARRLLPDKTLCWNVPADVLTREKAAIQQYVDRVLKVARADGRIVLSVSNPCPIEAWLEGYPVVAEALEQMQ